MITETQNPAVSSKSSQEPAVSSKSSQWPALEISLVLCERCLPKATRKTIRAALLRLALSWLTFSVGRLESRVGLEETPGSS